MRARYTRGAYTGVVPWTVSADLEATAPGWEPKSVHDIHMRLCFCRILCNVPLLAGLFVFFQHCLHVSSPKEALTPCHDLPSNPANSKVFTRASKVDHFVGKLFQYLTRCANSPYVCVWGGGRDCRKSSAYDVPE